MPDEQYQEFHFTSHHISCICAQTQYIPIFPPFNKKSYKSSLWVISGIASTDLNGFIKIDINSYLAIPICGVSVDKPWLTPIIIDKDTVMILSPQSVQPILLTVKPSAVETFLDHGQPLYTDVLDGSFISRHISKYSISYEISSYALDGNLVGGVKFSWLCFAEAALLDIIM